MERIFIEKRSPIDIESKDLLRECKEYLKIKDLKDLRIIDVYDLEGANEKEKVKILENVMIEKLTDRYASKLDIKEDELFFRIKSLKGQFNQREYFTNQFVRLIFPESPIKISHSRIIVFSGINKDQLQTIKKYYINPIEYKEIALELVRDKEPAEESDHIEWVEGFIDFSKESINLFEEEYGIGMDRDDLIFIQDYFKKEGRDPSLTEVKLIDTYWSDHCRHTTFNTRIDHIEVEDGKYKDLFEREIKRYLRSREDVYGEKEKSLSLMDLATINMKELKKKGMLQDKEDTDEINAASIEIDVARDGKTEKWLLMFKNETHNHPTEMEPFGGAATCLGGAIRDPLSGRAYVYQAMRISGSADPRKDFKDTLEGKLAQRKISRTAMKGYSSYGNEIGASTGYVREIYDEGFLAKRMECGALLAAAPKENVYRGKAEAGDIIVLVGGRTGRDGLGGAVGSSKEHSTESLDKGGAEVQKGNPSLERKIMRLFRKKHVSRMIKVCNDFGAGGVGVAIGELADGIRVDLDRVPLKYPGLSPMEITLSESQERMACLIDKENMEAFLKEAELEDLEATVVAGVTEEKVLEFLYKGEKVVSIKREFLDTNGVEKNTDVRLLNPGAEVKDKYRDGDVETRIYKVLEDINITSQKGLVENFDNTVSGETVLMPFGGKFMMSPSEGMVSRIPMEEGKTTTVSLMTHGYDPQISKWSPFHGGYFAVVESLARIRAMGGSYKKVRLSFQEYFERLGTDKEKWGKPFLSLLGAFSIQKSLDIASIGGKDSMSGSFEDIDVPPTLISFAVTSAGIKDIVTSDFKEPGNRVALIDIKRDGDGLLDIEDLKKKYDVLDILNKKGNILSSQSVKSAGPIRSILEMSFGNKIGFKCKDIDIDDLFKTKYGSIVVELTSDTALSDLGDFILLGQTIKDPKIIIDELELSIDDLIKKWEEPMQEVFPINKEKLETEKVYPEGEKSFLRKGLKILKPKVIIPILTGTHGEYTMARSFRRAGGDVEEFVFKLKDHKSFSESLLEFKKKIRKNQILAFPDGMVFASEPGGGGKLLKYILNEAGIREEIDRFLNNTDGLIIGIGGAFNALLKAGLIVKEGVLAQNKEEGFISTFAHMLVKNNSSPWFNAMNKGDIYSAPIGTYEGRLILGKDTDLVESQISTKFIEKNPTGSVNNIESLTSRDGRILGTIANIDRMDEDLYKNINIKGKNSIFESGIKYFD